MAAIKNVKYLNKECIYQYFHNPNEAFLEGFIVDENPIFCPRNCESGVYIKIFKVPVNSRVNEIYMQEFRWEAWKNGYNTPLPSDYSNNFKKAGYSIDSTRFWSLPNYLISVCPKLKAELIDYQQQFEQASQASWNGSTGMSLRCYYVASDSQFCITGGSHLRQQSQNRYYLPEMRIRKERRMASLYRRCLSNRRRMPGVFRKSPCRRRQ